MIKAWMMKKASSGSPSYGADVCTGGSAFNIGEYNRAAVSAFDNNNSSYSQNRTDPYQGNEVTQGYDFGAGVTKIPAQYTIRITTGGGYYPSAWKFYGSNNFTDWTLLDTVTGQTFAAGEQKTFNGFSNSTAYRYVKWGWTTLPDYFGLIAELEVMEAA